MARAGGVVGEGCDDHIDQLPVGMDLDEPIAAGAGYGSRPVLVVAQTEANKGRKSDVLDDLVKEGATDIGDAQGDATERLVRNIVFACDAY